MQPLDLEQLRTLVAVVDAGSLTAAAPVVFLSQSAVSEKMRKLEQRIGHTLLTRSKAGVAPTPAGLRLLAHARRLLAASDEALRDLGGETLQGELRLAVTDYFRPGELSRLLSRLGQSYPQLRLHVNVLQGSAMEAAFGRGEFDIGLAMRINPAASRTGARGPGAPLRREALAWVAAEGHRIVRGEPLRLLVLPDSCSLHQFTIRLLRERRVPHAVAHVASGVAGLQSALAAGLGVACLNESALCAGVARLPAPHGLPSLPRVAFQFLPARRAEPELVTRVRELLAAQLV
ncbi:LysR family transcriptional regulator [Variovorax saccharolyticus]|uniref:LysR family transcriptional regulator n=1 Tax=Variovorax saccharolyticus TaxID=3053516 RepID=UPI002578F8AC|nr:LysR substrate-binding domain-containing protein [Variovorax sp. J22R187]MDM0017811.1 LysR substrate-binding domain-containing protein [Variovorax sp. J22R187]